MRMRRTGRKGGKDDSRSPLSGSEVESGAVDFFGSFLSASVCWAISGPKNAQNFWAFLKSCVLRRSCSLSFCSK